MRQQYLLDLPHFLSPPNPGGIAISDGTVLASDSNGESFSRSLQLWPGKPHKPGMGGGFGYTGLACGLPGNGWDCAVLFDQDEPGLWLTTFDSSRVKTDDDGSSLHGDGNSTRQLVLFLDDTQLSEVKGDIAVQLNKPVKHERPVLTPTEPWESWAILFYNTVLFVAEDDVRLYYSCAAQGPCPAGENCDDLVTGYWHTCLAISQDGGLTFVKPSLGVAVFNGSKQNNIVCEVMSLSRSHHLPSR